MPGSFARRFIIFRVRPMALTAGVSAPGDADDAVDDEVDADRSGHDRKDRRPGSYQTIPQVGQVRFGLPWTPREVQENQADGGRGQEGEYQEGEDDDGERLMVAH
jgi:hypothetical protein